jgi:hypothetical protein
VLRCFSYLSTAVVQLLASVMGDNLDENWEVEAADASAEADLVEGASDSSEDEAELSESDDDAAPSTSSKKRPLSTSGEGSSSSSSSKKAPKHDELKAKKKRKRIAAEDDAIAAARGDSAEAVVDVLWARCRAVLGPKLAEIELLSPWLTPSDIAVVEKFGQHSTPKLPGFIKGKQQYRLLIEAAYREAYI